MRGKHKKRRSRGDRAFEVINVIFMGTLSFICLFPFYYVVINSISDSALVTAGKIIFIPRGINFENYRRVFQIPRIAQASLVSLLRTVLGTLAAVTGATVVGYTMSKTEFWHRKFWYRFIIVTMYFGAGMIPNFLNIKQLGLMDNFWVYVIPSFVTPFSVIMTKTYMESIPSALEESAYMDGAGYGVRFFRIALPLSKPIIATTATFAAVGQWNSYMDTLLYMHGKKYQTLQSLLQQMMSQVNAITSMMNEGDLAGAEMLAENMSTRTVRFTMTAVTVLPILFVYPFFQRYFTKGIMIGAVKG